ncbi:MAG: DUF433 domain-containing protein, partial [Vicinamibacteria bacterium]
VSSRWRDGGISQGPGFRVFRHRRLDGSRIAVTDIVAAQQDGYRPEEIRTLFGASLSLAQVHAALAYYYDHPAEIEEEFRLQAECFDQGEAERDRFLKARG